jgi:predicted nucleic acid-binding protein
VTFLLDTNVVSEAMKKAPEPAVVSWFERNQDRSYISSVVIAEVELGIELLPDGTRKEKLNETWRQFLPLLEGRMLMFDLKVARKWAKLCAQLERQGRRPPILDSMIEAIALEWGMTVVTRNISDFIQAPTLNPWNLRA